MAAPIPPAELTVKDLEQIFRENHALVFRAAYRITANAGDAEDVLQTVFLRLVKGQDDYDWSKNPEAYLSRAASPNPARDANSEDPQASSTVG